MRRDLLWVYSRAIGWKETRRDDTAEEDDDYGKRRTFLFPVHRVTQSTLSPTRSNNAYGSVAEYMFVQWGAQLITITTVSFCSLLWLCDGLLFNDTERALCHLCRTAMQCDVSLDVCIL